jgi:hypothetical protein
MVADHWLRQREGVVEIAYASLASLVRRDQRRQPHRVGERLQQRGDPLG